jgi:hypothetical protein
MENKRTPTGARLQRVPTYRKRQNKAFATQVMIAH